MENKSTATREPTYGEKFVYLTPDQLITGNIQKVNKLYAEIIDLCNNLRTEAGQSEKGRLFSVAITEAQTAQMWAVKAMTWKI